MLRSVIVQTHELLTTGEAAVLLRSSRQHVVDLCERGLLPHVRVGTHRRLRRQDVEALLQPSMTRDDLRALWLHRAVAGKLVADPQGTLATATRNLHRLQAIHCDPATAVWLERWSALLDEGVEAVLYALTSPAAYSIALRRHSPFAGVLDETERRAVLTSFADSWRDRARRMRREQLELVLRVT
jgi:excisionase family DNA binding protein